MDGWTDDRWIVDGKMDGVSPGQMRESCVARAGHREEGRKSSPMRPILGMARESLGLGGRMLPLGWAVVATLPLRT